jgi:site-specific DNA recombinase
LGHEQTLKEPTSIFRSPAESGHRQRIEQLQQALNHWKIREEAAQVLRGLIEHVSVGRAEQGIEVEIVGEIAKMLELGIWPNAKQVNLDERLTRSVKMVAGRGFEPLTFRL